MPTYLYFGENEFFLSRAIKQLKTHTLLGVCSKEILLQLESILPKILSTNTLLITNTHKPDARNKSVKLLLEYAQV
jgi:DNA polymerase-3 subunit delta